MCACFFLKKKIIVSRFFEIDLPMSNKTGSGVGVKSMAKLQQFYKPTKKNADNTVYDDELLSQFMLVREKRFELFLVIFNKIVAILNHIYDDSNAENQENPSETRFYEMLNDMDIVEKLESMKQINVNIQKNIRENLGESSSYDDEENEEERSLKKAIVQLAFQTTTLFMDIHVISLNVPNALMNATNLKSEGFLNYDQEVYLKKVLPLFEKPPKTAATTTGHARQDFPKKPPMEYSKFDNAFTNDVQFYSDIGFSHLLEPANITFSDFFPEDDAGLYGAKSGLENGIQTNDAVDSFKYMKRTFFKHFDFLESLKSLWDEQMLTSLFSTIYPSLGKDDDDIEKTLSNMFDSHHLQISPFLANNMLKADFTSLNRGGDGLTIPFDLDYGSKMGIVKNRVFVKFNTINELYPSNLKQAPKLVKKSAFEKAINESHLKKVLNTILMDASFFRNTCERIAFHLNDLIDILESIDDDSHVKRVDDMMDNLKTLKSNYDNMLLDQTEIERIITEYAVGKYIVGSSKVAHQHFPQFVKLAFINDKYTKMSNFQRILNHALNTPNPGTTSSPKVNPRYKALDLLSHTRYNNGTVNTKENVRYDEDSIFFYEELCQDMFGDLIDVFYTTIPDPVFGGYKQIPKFGHNIDVSTFFEGIHCIKPFFNASLNGKKIIDEPIPMIVLNNVASTLPNKDFQKPQNYEIRDLNGVLMDELITNDHSEAPDFKIPTDKLGFFLCDFIIQYANAFEELSEKFNLSHNDAHGGNIFVETSGDYLTRIDSKNLSYQSKNRLKIIDMGRCSFELNKATIGKRQTVLSNYVFSGGHWYNKDNDNVAFEEFEYAKDANVLLKKNRQIFDQFDTIAKKTHSHDTFEKYKNYEKLIVALNVEKEKSEIKKVKIYTIKKNIWLNTTLQEVLEPIVRSDTMLDIKALIDDEKDANHSQALDTTPFSDLFYTLRIITCEQLRYNLKWIEDMYQSDKIFSTLDLFKQTLFDILKERREYTHATNVDQTYDDILNKIMKNYKHIKWAHYETRFTEHIDETVEIFERSCVCIKILAHVMYNVTYQTCYGNDNDEKNKKPTNIYTTILEELLGSYDDSSYDMFSYENINGRNILQFDLKIEVSEKGIERRHTPNLANLKHYFIKMLEQCHMLYAPEDDEYKVYDAHDDIATYDASTYEIKHHEYLNESTSEISKEYATFVKKSKTENAYTDVLSSYVQEESNELNESTKNMATVLESAFMLSPDARVSDVPVDSKKSDYDESFGVAKTEKTQAYLAKIKKIVNEEFLAQTTIMEETISNIKKDFSSKNENLTDDFLTALLPANPIERKTITSEYIKRESLKAFLNKLVEKTTTKPPSTRPAKKNASVTNFVTMGDVVSKILKQPVKMTTLFESLEDDEKRETTSLKKILDVYNDFHFLIQKIAFKYVEPIAKISESVSKLTHLARLFRIFNNDFKLEETEENISSEIMTKLTHYLLLLKNTTLYYAVFFESIEKNMENAIKEATDAVLEKEGYDHIKLDAAPQTQKDYFFTYFKTMLLLKMRMFESNCIDILEISTVAFESALKIKKTMLSDR